MGVVEVKDEDQTALKATSQISLAAAAVLEAMERFTVGCGCVARCECQEWDPATQPPVLGFIIKENIYGRCRSHIGMGGIRLYVPKFLFQQHYSTAFSSMGRRPSVFYTYPQVRVRVR